MTDQLPDPLVPAEVDLSDFQYMELDVLRLRDSRFVSEVKPEAFRAGVMLWCAAWHQVPAGSVPDNDVELAKLAGYGFAVREWKKVKAQTLTKFVRCSDGRLYHEEVSAKAVSAWHSRLEHFYDRARERLRKANKARASETPPRPALPELTFEQWNAQRIASGIPKEKADAVAGIPAPPVKPSAGIPPENALKGEGEGEGEGTERERDKKKEEPPPAPPPDGAGRDVQPPETAGHAHTPYGAITRRLKAAGLSRVNPGELRFKALVDAGATAEEFLAYADKALVADDPFAYLVATVEGERKRAAKAAGQVLRGPVPNRQEALEQRNRAVAQQWAAKETAP